MADKIEIAKKHLSSFASGDWNTYRSLLVDGVAYEEEATRRHIQGADKVIEAVKAWKTAFPDLKATIKETVASGDAVVAEVEWQGTHKGTLSGPMGTIPASNRTGKVPAVLVFRFDGDKIRELKNYFDLMTLLSQIGALPQQPAAPVGH